MENPVKVTVVAPKKYGNEYFDKMECPLELFPDRIWCKYRDRDNKVQAIQLPKEEICVEGNFVMRKYAGTRTHLIARALDSRKIYHKALIFDNEVGVEVK